MGVLGRSSFAPAFALRPPAGDEYFQVVLSGAIYGGDRLGSTPGLPPCINGVKNPPAKC